MKGNIGKQGSDGGFGSRVGRRTAAGGEIFNDYKSNIAITENSIASGSKNIAGAKGYYYKSIDMTNKIVYLGTEQITPVLSSENYTDNTFPDTGYAVGDEVTLINDAHYDLCACITAIEHNKVTLDNIPFASFVNMTELGMDDWCLYVPSKPNPDNEYAYPIFRNATAEGEENIAAGLDSDVSGRLNLAAGNFSHVHGRQNIAVYAATAEGKFNKALGEQSHVEGAYNEALGDDTHVEGRGNIATADKSHVQGRYNVIDTLKKYAHIVGNGTSDTNRKNAHTLDWSGNAWFLGDITVGAGNKRLATEEYVEENLGNMQSRIDDVEAIAESKVPKVDGKGLSSNDYTDEEKEKLAAIELNAQPADLTVADRQFLNSVQKVYVGEILLPFVTFFDIDTNGNCYLREDGEGAYLMHIPKDGIPRLRLMVS